MRPRTRLAAIASLLAPVLSTRATPEVLFVAVGGSVDLAGAAREGDPARIASRLEQVGRRVRLVDLTVPGANARAVVETQLRNAISLRPTLVTIAVGPLDATRRTPLAAFSRDLQILADLLHRTRATVVISTLAPAEGLREAPSAAYRRRVDAFNWAVRRISRRNGLIVVDVRKGGTSWEAAVGGAVVASVRAAGGASEDGP